MRIFGSSAYALDTHPTSKLDPKAIKSIFVGYGDRFGIKAYRLFLPAAHKFIYSRSVAFLEEPLLQPPPPNTLSTATTHSNPVPVYAIYEEPEPLPSAPHLPTRPVVALTPSSPTLPSRPPLQFYRRRATPRAPSCAQLPHAPPAPTPSAHAAPANSAQAASSSASPCAPSAHAAPAQVASSSASPCAPTAHTAHPGSPRMQPTNQQPSNFLTFDPPSIVPKSAPKFISNSAPAHFNHGTSHPHYTLPASYIFSPLSAPFHGPISPQPALPQTPPSSSPEPPSSAAPSPSSIPPPHTAMVRNTLTARMSTKPPPAHHPFARGLLPGRTPLGFPRPPTPSESTFSLPSSFEEPITPTSSSHTSPSGGQASSHASSPPASEDPATDSPLHPKF